MSDPERFPMKWHKFQMVIIGSVITMISGITYITGYAYTQQGFMAAASAATGVNLFTASTLGSVGGTVLFLFINSVYYSRRRELFTR